MYYFHNFVLYDMFLEFPALLHAFIPIAPVSTEKFTVQQYKLVSVPTFIVYGMSNLLSLVCYFMYKFKLSPKEKT